MRSSAVVFTKNRPRIYTLVLDGCIIDDKGAVIQNSIFDTIGSHKGILKNLYDNTYMGCSMAFLLAHLLSIALPFPKGIPMHDSWLGLLSRAAIGTVDFVPEKTIKYRTSLGKQELTRSFKVSQQVKWRCFLAYHLIQEMADLLAV